MDPEITDTVTEWEPVAVGSGDAGLRSLAADEFSGAVTAGLAWAFFLNGRIVGVFDGDIEDLSDADLTAYRAPDPSLPLLFAMRELGGETRGQYYTEKTPLEEVDRTLSSGSFTGYVELSENVLSGDYYVVYYGGKSMSVAFVGASERLISGDEAFELAADEVGIYDVNAVEITVVDIPGADPSAGTTTDDGDEDGPSLAGAGVSAGGDGDDGVDASDAGIDGVDASNDGVDGVGVSDGGDEDGPSVVGVGVSDDGDDVGAGDDDVGADDGGDAGVIGPDDVTFGGDDESDATTAPTADDSREDGAASFGRGTDHEGDDDRVRGLAAGANDPTGGSSDDPGTGRDDADEGLGSEAANGTDSEGAADDGADATGRTGEVDDGPTGWGEQTAGTADTEESEPAADSDEPAGADGTTAGGGGSASESTPSTVGADDHRGDGERDPDPSSSASTAVHHDGPSDEELQSLRERLAATETERDELTATVADLESQLETARAERDEYRERVAELEAEIEQLRERVEAGATSGTDGPNALSPKAARDGTNLFVRYRSKGDPTLEDARAGDATQEAVVGNLRLEYHTTFDDGAVTVDDEPYETFLHATTEWRFVRWVVEDLLYEIGRSGHRADMAELFDRIPEIDRVQLNGEVAVTVDDGEGERHESREFDLVFRNSMGDPLFVTSVENGRTATTDEAVERLLEGARAVGTSKETLGAAFFVTTSFFEPEALDAVGSETQTGLLSRNTKTSYVKLSRKQGYHLCLVEARGDGFHMNTPEL